MKGLPQHSSGDPNWGTPVWIVDACREALGGTIELDPASSAAANTGVGAQRIIAPPDDGLMVEWRADTVFLNPPGGIDRSLKPRWDTTSRQVAWWRKLAVEFAVDRVKRAVFLAFSIELLQTAQRGLYCQPLAYQLCVPRRRIAFDRVAADGSRAPGPSPTHANVIIGLGCDENAFRSAMSVVGVTRL